MECYIYMYIKYTDGRMESMEQYDGDVYFVQQQHADCVLYC